MFTRTNSFCKNSSELKTLQWKVTRDKQFTVFILFLWPEQHLDLPVGSHPIYNPCPPQWPSWPPPNILRAFCPDNQTSRWLKQRLYKWNTAASFHRPPLQPPRRSWWLYTVCQCLSIIISRVTSVEELSHLAERDRSEEDASDKAPDRKSR